MSAIKNTEEVYRKYLERFGLDGDGDPDAIALFTYSLVEKDHFDWLEHYRTENAGSNPTPSEIENWYASKPESYFEEKYQRALQWFRAFARELLKEEIKEQRLDAIKETVGDRLSFFPQLWISLTTNAIFVILLGAVAAYVVTDFSPIAWVKSHLLKT